LIVRTTVHAAGRTADDSVTVAARLIDRRGKTIVQLPLTRATPGEGHQLDLPLTSIAPGEFAIAFEAARGDEHAEAMVPFRVIR
jgi:hypothetical protein